MLEVVVRWLLLCALAGCSFRIASVAGGGDDEVPIDAAIGGDAVDAPDDVAPPIDAAPQIDATIAGPWWNPAWGMRLPLTIQTTSALPMGFQIGVQINLDAAPCAGSREQVRVVRSDTTEITRSIDELGGDEWIWFRIAAPIAAGATTTEYALYCANANANAAPSDPAVVFELHEDFNAALAATKWMSQGTVSVGAGALTLASGGTIHSTATYGPGYAIDVLLAAAAGAVQTPYFWAGFQQTFTVTLPWVIWVGRAAGEIHPEYRDGAGTWSGTQRTLDTAVHLYGVEHYGALARYRLANAPLDTHPYAALAAPLNVRLHNYMSGGSVRIDMVRVRRAVDPLPVVTVGMAEAFPL